MPQKQTFEEKMEKLEQITKSLERGDVPLDEAMKLFQEGMELSKSLDKTLTQAETTLTKIMKNNQEEDFEDANV